MINGTIVKFMRERICELLLKADPQGNGFGFGEESVVVTFAITKSKSVFIKAKPRN